MEALHGSPRRYVCRAAQKLRDLEADPHVNAAAFLEVNKPHPIVLFEVVKGFLTGSTPELGEMHHVEKG